MDKLKGSVGVGSNLGLVGFGGGYLAGIDGVMGAEFEVSVGKSTLPLPVTCGVGVGGPSTFVIDGNPSAWLRETFTDKSFIELMNDAKYVPDIVENISDGGQKNDFIESVFVNE